MPFPAAPPGRPVPKNWRNTNRPIAYSSYMSETQQGEGIRPSRLRLWPGVAAVILGLGLRLGLPLAIPEAMMYSILGGLACAVIVLLWWLLFSRAPWLDRVGALALIVAGLAVTPKFLHESVATGFRGMLFPIYALPLLSLALVLWAAATRNLGNVPRRATLAATIIAVCGGFALLRTEGVIGSGSQFAWRWTKSAEQKLLASTAAELPTPPPPAPPVATPAPKEKAEPQPAEAKPAVKADAPVTHREVPPAPDWPGFRGPQRDSVIHGSRIGTDWASAPPVEVWRRPVGPGWSSFAIGNGLIYTQEQRGDQELVSCYRLSNGEPVWAHRDNARFWESNGGAGPRGTPTLHSGRVYALGATGILNVLDASTGALVWTKNVAASTAVKVPFWGFSSSPIVVDDAVIVAASGVLASYGLTTGEERWIARTGGGSYSSPHLVTMDGVAQVVLLSGTGATSVSPETGKVLWKYAWPGSTILQPAVMPTGGLLLAANDDGGGAGTRRLAIALGPGGWTAEERWTTRGLKPYFSDFVIHKGHAFGFDGSILSCISLEDGVRKWKGGRYGSGQMLLLADQDLLLVLSEQGELALVSATAGGYTEIGRFRAMDGKTWNHPALTGNLLLVRNGEEMVAFRLPTSGS